LNARTTPRYNTCSGDPSVHPHTQFVRPRTFLIRPRTLLVHPSYAHLSTFPRSPTLATLGRRTQHPAPPHHNSRTGGDSWHRFTHVSLVSHGTCAQQERYWFGYACYALIPTLYWINYPWNIYYPYLYITIDAPYTNAWGTRRYELTPGGRGVVGHIYSEEAEYRSLPTMRVPTTDPMTKFEDLRDHQRDFQRRNGLVVGPCLLRHELPLWWMDYTRDLDDSKAWREVRHTAFLVRKALRREALVKHSMVTRSKTQELSRAHEVAADDHSSTDDPPCIMDCSYPHDSPSPLCPILSREPSHYAYPRHLTALRSPPTEGLPDRRRQGGGKG
jgi:hypothetical protein